MKILIVESIDDCLSLDRQAYMAKAEKYRDYDFYHFYPVQLTVNREQIRDIHYHMKLKLSNGTVHYEDIRKRLLEAIEVFHPDVLVLYGGLYYFCAHQDAVQLMMETKRQYPDLPITMKEGIYDLDMMYLISSRCLEQYDCLFESVFDLSEDMKTISNAIF